MTRAFLALCVSLIMALPALADAPTTSPHPVLRPAPEIAQIRPVARPEVATPVTTMATKAPRLPAGVGGSAERADQLLQRALAGLTRQRLTPQVQEATFVVRPVPRGSLGSLAAGLVDAPKLRDTILARSPLPALRPKNLPARTRNVVRAAVVTTPTPARPTSRRGAVCGDPSIKGENLSAIAGRLNGCGVDQPVRVSSIDGVVLSTPATMDCVTAAALKNWINDGVRPAVGRTGGGVKGLYVMGHYSCRTRNSLPGAKISEHGKGRAIDIGGIILKNDTQISVLRGWRTAGQSEILRRIHAAACGPFGTVLGPNADRFHQDHFHFDTARYRSGSYCR